MGIVARGPEWYILKSQFATLRADIHVTHLWLQSIIMDQADTFSLVFNNLSPGIAHSTPTFDWYTKEDLCRQMLLLLCSISESSFEALGVHVVYKVRDVAAVLLSCPYTDMDQSEHGVGPATRAKEYLRDFTDN
ncbi:hypothetical protein LTS08_008492 [Lithohypha guttulata]|nr:hypothetical protein LTS08_008492 [Lithohypha guttulata]